MSYTMIQSSDFFMSILNAMKDHVVVIDNSGHILYVNRAWQQFNQNNSQQSDIHWTRVNYLSVCEQASKAGDAFGKAASDGIYDVIEGRRYEFYLEYPCHSPTQQRWFMMQTTPCQIADNTYFVISHRDITKRKLAEEQVQILSQTDGLTELFNRRHFDEYLALEWQRCKRLKTPISLAIIDIDHFKALNDNYGHVAGDKCLKKIARLLKQQTKRPTDMCARYGGEEFVLVYGNTDIKQAQILLQRLLTAIRELAIPNKNSPTAPFITASIGLATMLPDMNNTQAQLIKSADTMLYMAKENGRDQIISEHYQANQSLEGDTPSAQAASIASH